MAMIDSHVFGALEVNDGSSRAVEKFSYPALTPTPEFADHMAANLPEKTFLERKWMPRIYNLSIVHMAATADALSVLVDETYSAIERDVPWKFTPRKATHGLAANVHSLSVSETYTPMVDGRTACTLVCAITADPLWRHVEGAVETSATLATGAGTVSVLAVKGTDDALTSVRCTCDGAGEGAKGLGAGLFSAASLTGYVPVEQYAGTADATASDGAHARITTGAAYAAVGTAVAFGTAQNAGLIRPLARVRTASSPASDGISRVGSKVSASGIAATREALGLEIPSTVLTWETLDYGVLPVPSAYVPIAGQTGYGSVVTLEENVTAATTLTVNSYLSGVHTMAFFQTFPLLKDSDYFRITVNVATLPVGWDNDNWTLSLHSVAGGIPTTELDSDTRYTLAVGANVISPSWFGPAISADGDYAFVFRNNDATSGSIILTAGSGNPYADGDAGYRDGTGYHVSAGYDLLFEVEGRYPFGFNAYTPLYAKGDAANFDLDRMVRLPSDEGSSVTRYTLAAGDGVLWAAIDPDDRKWAAMLVEEGGGQGFSLDDETTADGYMLARPGDNAFVFCSIDSAAASPPALDVLITHIPRWRSPYGDAS